MISLLRQKLFVSLATNAKEHHLKPTRMHRLSSKNIKRIHKLRQNKKTNSNVSSLKKELDHHKNLNTKLKKDILTLKSTVDLFVSTIEKHDLRQSIAADILSKKETLDKIRSELDNLKAVLKEAKEGHDMSDKQLSSITSYIKKLELVIHKKESDLDASMLL